VRPPPITDAQRAAAGTRMTTKSSRRSRRSQERDLVLNHGPSLSQARELANRELFPETLDRVGGPKP